MKHNFKFILFFSSGLTILVLLSFNSCKSEKEKYFTICEQNLTEPNYIWQEGKMYYSFRKDGTFNMTNLESTETIKEHGNWKFDVKNGKIAIQFKGKPQELLQITFSNEDCSEFSYDSENGDYGKLSRVPILDDKLK